MCNPMREREAHRRRATRTVAARLAELRHIRYETDGYHGEDDDDEEDEDEQAPIWTSRVMFLGFVSSVSLLILNKYIFRQTIECIMGIASALVILYLLGYLMGVLVPKRRVYFPAFGLEFSLNPGPFSLREFAMISILANLGATYGGITSYSVDWSDTSV